MSAPDDTRCGGGEGAGPGRRAPSRRGLLAGLSSLALGAFLPAPLLAGDDGGLAGWLGGAAPGGAAQPGAGGAAGALRPHHRPRAKRVICLHMAGSPPQHDLLDPKPLLERYDRQPCPDEFLSGERFAFIKGHPKVLASPYRFARHGQSGAQVSELLPHTAAIADKLTIVRSMHTDQFNHAPAQLLLYSGSPRLGRPSLGSWLSYGLGTENRDLPGYVVLVSGGNNPSAGKSVWGSGFLPSVHQGTELRSAGDPVLFLSDPAGMDRAGRRRSLDVLARLNALAAARGGAAGGGRGAPTGGGGDLLPHPESLTRQAQYELAFRMQASVPEAADLSAEPPSVHALYGSEPGGSSFANNCLLARRLVERGVRFVQLFDWGWDIHGTGPSDDLMTQLPKQCRRTDRAAAALVLDLERRGLLEDTLVLWTGEFGRTAMNEERNGSTFLGRDHHPHAFSLWMAGGGLAPGLTYGATDDFGYRITEDPVHVHDLQATILHLLGLDHVRLTHRYQGRDFRLTDVAGRVVQGLLA